LQPVDPDTLTNVSGFEPLQLPACSSGLIVQPSGALAVAVTGASGWPQRCAGADSAALRVLDLNTWTWQPDVVLPAASNTDTDQPLRLDGTGRWPIAWSADGRSVYTLTASPSEQRRLWSIDTSGANPPASVAIDFVPARLDVAPNGSALFVLGGQTAGNSRQGAVVQGSAFVAIYDPKTLVERIRVPLSGLSLGAADSQSGTLTPGVAVAPDGSRYYITHADRPVLDVVDTRAPRLERLERSVSLRDSQSAVGTRQAWLGVSPDGSHLYVWHRAETPQDDLGLQVVDTRTWQVQTLDAIAQRMGTSLDGRWIFELDPPASSQPGAMQPQQRGPRDPSGARLSVLDATTRAEAAVLSRDQRGLNVGHFGADRLYVSQFGRGPSGDRPTATLAAYDTSSWREIAARALDVPGALVTTSALW
jgi:DNA-binding beta-propeller fold protein YncE